MTQKAAKAFMSSPSMLRLLPPVWQMLSDEAELLQQTSLR